MLLYIIIIIILISVAYPCPKHACLLFAIIASSTWLISLTHLSNEFYSSRRVISSIISKHTRLIIRASFSLPLEEEAYRKAHKLASMKKRLSSSHLISTSKSLRIRRVHYICVVAIYLLRTQPHATVGKKFSEFSNF